MPGRSEKIRDRAAGPAGLAGVAQMGQLDRRRPTTGHRLAGCGGPPAGCGRSAGQFFSLKITVGFSTYGSKTTGITKTLRRTMRLAGGRAVESQRKVKLWFAENIEETKI